MSDAGIAVLRRPRDMRRRGLPGLRAAALLLAILVPIASAAWAFAGYVAGREVEQSKAHVSNVLRAAAEEYDDVVREAGAQARGIAAEPSVQHALTRRGAPLPPVARAAGVEVRRGGGAPRGATATARVVRGGRTLGTVAITVSLDGRLARRLLAATPADRHDRIAFAIGDSPLAHAGPRPAVIHLPRGGALAAAMRLSHKTGAPRLVALRDQGTVRAAADDARGRVLVVSAAALLLVAFFSYGFAPLIARNRTALRQRAQAARVLSQLADGVCEVDRSGRVTFWNPAATAITGLHADDVVGRPAGEAVPGWEAFPVAARPGVQEQADAIPVEIGDRELWLSVSAVAADESVVYAFRDLTAKRRLDEMRDELVATMSHELRTPLAAVYGAAMTLRAGAADEKLRERLVDVVVDHAERLARVVDQVLLASELAERRVGTREEVIDVSEAVAATLAELRAPPDGTVVWRADGPLPALGDAVCVRQILGNLLDNALKYSPSRGTVTITASAGDEGVRIDVCDEGAGVPESERELVFEKFYRLDPQMRSGVGGTGLGLYIARELALRMGGRLELQSAPGAGSTFRLTLRQPR
ncbi:MAG: sensor histidine kinase [Gaiellaceae bacterium]